MSDYKELEWLISETKVLIDHAATSSTPGFIVWKSKAERFLMKRFGSDSFEVKSFKDIRFTPSVATSNTDYSKKCKDGLVAAALIFQSYLDEMKENSSSETTIAPPSTYNKIFIVHGHDGELKHSVARIVEKQGIEAIILSEQANQGRTIIEKFEDYSDVDGAICLFTSDDLGRVKSNPDEQPRARQNVVFEAGYFMGKLGRSNVVIIAEAGVELPSDMQGIVYTDKNNWQFDVLKELKAMGYNIDYNKLD